MKFKYTMLAIATSAALLAATAAAVESPLGNFPSLSGKLKGGQTDEQKPVQNAAPKPAATPASTAPTPVAAKPNGAAQAKASPVAAPASKPKPAAVPASKPAPQPPASAVAAAPARKPTAAPAASAVPAKHVGERFATAPTPAPSIASVQAPAMATMASSSQVRPFVLSYEEANHLAAERDLKRQIRLLKLRADAAELQRKIDGEDKQAPVPDSVNVVAAPVQDPKGSVLDLPPPQPFRLVSVWGESNNLQADLLINGVRVPVAVGHQLPEGWTVSAITANAVQIKRGRKAMALKIGG